MTEDSISLKWEEPEDDGGCLITSYVLEKREAHKMSWDKAGKTEVEEFTAGSLTEGQQYAFRVAAKNEIGTGPFVELSKTVAPKSLFGKYPESLIYLVYNMFRSNSI